MRTLYELVKEAWINATCDNAYDFSDHTDEDVALDMLAYDAELEGCDDVAAITAEVTKVRREFPA
ncbi:hypothetical protein [Mesorhizobium sp.]|uniref:hypothetical protein n=1 Tax=Mesorhizobium sp. TaxID=1871066 RepID=UPI000FE6F10E|nr:hypothetical protein [Mesorhizobium sp.]RWM84290.1 MAG: hypothetical protein EOR83_16845 [Mesorhizobium sp.]